MALELVSFASLKALLDLTDAAITDYPALDLIRTSVTSAIEEYVDRLLEEEERIETIYAGRFKVGMIRLPAVPITSVSSVTVTIGEDDETLTEHEEYEITNYGIKLFAPIVLAKIVIVYTGGIEDADVTASMARAALLQTAYEFQSKDQVGATSITTAGGNVNRPALGLLKEVQRMLVKDKHPLTQS